MGAKGAQAPTTPLDSMEFVREEKRVKRERKKKRGGGGAPPLSSKPSSTSGPSRRAVLASWQLGGDGEANVHRASLQGHTTSIYIRGWDSWYKKKKEASRCRCPDGPWV